MTVSNTYEGAQQLKIAGVMTVAHFKGFDCKRDGEAYSLAERATGQQVFCGPIDAALAYIQQ